MFPACITNGDLSGTLLVFTVFPCRNRTPVNTYNEAQGDDHEAGRLHYLIFIVAHEDQSSILSLWDVGPIFHLVTVFF